MVGGIPRLELIDATLGYDSVEVVRNVHLSVMAGELVGLFGCNGSGKSTVMRAVVGLARVLRGRVEVNGCVTKRIDLETAARKLRIGYLPQNNRGIPTLTVEENLELAAWGAGKRRNRRELVRSLLQEPDFEGLGQHRSRPVGALSGGQRFRVALGMLSLLNPEVVLLDEPSSGADEEARSGLCEFLERKKQESCGVLLIEQEVEVWEVMCERFYWIEGGRVTLGSKSKELGS